MVAGEGACAGRLGVDVGEEERVELSAEELGDARWVEGKKEWKLEERLDCNAAEVVAPMFVAPKQDEHWKLLVLESDIRRRREDLPSGVRRTAPP